jgi:hypothetical protein
MEIFRRPVDVRALYGAVSRARDQAHLYTDDRAMLIAAITTWGGMPGGYDLRRASTQASTPTVLPLSPMLS